MYSMELKLPWCFYLLMEKPLGCYFQVRSPYYQAAQHNQKTPIHVSSRRQVRSEKAKTAWASSVITATTSIQLPKPVSTDLTIKSESVLTKEKMGCKAGWWNKTSVYPIIVTLKAKEAPSLHDIRLTLLDTNPVFQFSRRHYLSSISMSCAFMLESSLKYFFFVHKSFLHL